MKENSVFISLGRGQCVDETALKVALDSKLAGAALDVFGTEPLPKESWIWDHPKVIVSPHNADHTWDMWEDAAKMTAERFREYLSGGKFSTIVDKQYGY